MPNPNYATTTILLTLMVLGQVNAVASDSSPSPTDQYRVLEWSDLVPKGWEPSMLAPAYNDTRATKVDEGAVVAALDKQLSAIPGYMKPVVYDGNQVTEFLLVPYLQHQINAHAHLEANQMVYVYALKPIVVENPLEPIWVVGAMSLEPVMTDEGPAAYRIVDAVTTEYEY